MPLSQVDAASEPAQLVSPVRTPHLPCVTEGLASGYTGVRSLSIGLLAQPSAAVQRIKSAWQIYPEAMPPLLGGILLDRIISRKGTDHRVLRETQADLFELAANSSSMFSKAPRLARFLAARSQFNLAGDSGPDAGKATRSCLQNVRRACLAGGCSAKELNAYFDFAMRLKDYDLARSLLVQWQGIEPENIGVKRGRVDLELAVGALDEARNRLQQMLARSPADPWALNRKAVVAQERKKMATENQ
jgi:tetratricopeptide (TPR) repeat protein